MIKNIQIEHNEIAFNNLNIGDFFIHKDQLYIKFTYFYEDYEYFGGVNIKDGTWYSIGEKVMVKTVNVDIRVY